MFCTTNFRFNKPFRASEAWLTGEGVGLDCGEPQVQIPTTAYVQNKRTKKKTNFTVIVQYANSDVCTLNPKPLETW